MKTDDLNLTVEELDELCRLYMDCQLSVLEEKELEYILSRTTLISESISEVKSLTNIQLMPRPHKTIRKTRFRAWKYISSIAASVAVILSVALYSTSSRNTSLSDVDSNVYIAAYSHGKRLSGNEAVEATNLAMTKADSLMNFAASTEREYMLRANEIINGTLNN